MKIYVDELPKSCKECPLYRSGRLKVKKGARYIDAETCVLGNFYKFQEIDDEIDTCPLETTQSLKQQVREEVVEEIKKQLAQENQQLKQQLAEKDKEIAYMTKQAKKFNNEAQKYYEDAYCNDFHNQDKISFAIQQLQRVKEKTKSFYGEYSASVVVCIIDQIIKEIGDAE